jgi:hypothetical protein
MKNFWFTVLLVVAAGTTAFGTFFIMNDAPEIRRAAREGDAMAWLRTEFKLDDAQFAAIKALHADYGLVCARHCRMIIAARDRGAPPAEISALEKTCVDSMTDHFQRVAALMSPAEGKRYLAMVMPRVAEYDHARGAPNVQVRP